MRRQQTTPETCGKSTLNQVAYCLFEIQISAVGPWSVTGERPRGLDDARHVELVLGESMQWASRSRSVVRGQAKNFPSAEV